jgi:hypothetical protein
MKIHVLHENAVWVEPLRQAFADLELPFEDWPLVEGTVDLGSVPPEGVFYNRMSASSHTRGHRYSPEMTSLVLAWLERHGRRVVNNTQALRLEVNKTAQYAALNAHGIRTPRTVAAVGRDAIVEAAWSFAPGPAILKPNRGGRGQGVHLFETVEDLRDHIHGEEFEVPIDGVSLVQDYIRAPEPFITRAEFVGGRFIYAVRVDTSHGFELCPADVCQTGDLGAVDGGAPTPQFTIVDTIDPLLMKKYQGFLAANGIEIAGIEFITDANGRVFTYDVNTNINYNAEAEARANKSGMNEVARFLGDELAKLSAASLGRLPLHDHWLADEVAGWA